MDYSVEPFEEYSINLFRTHSDEEQRENRQISFEERLKRLRSSREDLELKQFQLRSRMIEALIESIDDIAQNIAQA